MSESKEKQTNGTPVESQTQNTSSKNLSTDTADKLHRSVFNIFIIVTKFGRQRARRINLTKLPKMKLGQKHRNLCMICIRENTR